ncbi:hypothetical protein K1719_010036 [Acacia pycnantha]|nr:hypothetical protein K1719_010036 [Acacia pycnantha]
MRSKSETVMHLKHFVAYVSTQFSATVKRIRSDHGAEFVNNDSKEFFLQKGMVHETSCSYTSEQNGVVERKHRTIIQITRSLMLDSCIPIEFWGESVKMAVYLVNRLPSKILGYKSPYEIVYGAAPDLTCLRSFGCMTYATDLKISDKFQSRSIPSVFLGYPDNQKGYLLLNSKDKTVFVSRHVRFVEDNYPFQRVSASCPRGVNTDLMDMFWYDLVDPVVPNRNAHPVSGITNPNVDMHETSPTHCETEQSFEQGDLDEEMICTFLKGSMNLSQFMQLPTKAHMAAALKVVRYLKGSPGLGILISSEGPLRLECFCDSDWASCAVPRRSITGYALKLRGSLIMWKSKKQHTVSKSSAEAEYRALSMAVSEIVWVCGLLKDLGVEHHAPVNVFCDSQAAIHIAANPVFHERTKHIEIDCHFIREKWQQKLIDLKHIRSLDQQADMFTKTVTGDLQRKFLRKLSTIDLFSCQLEGEC